MAAVASFGDEILEFFGKHTSTVAQVTITDPQVQKQVELLSKQVLLHLPPIIAHCDFYGKVKIWETCWIAIKAVPNNPPCLGFFIV